MPRGRAPSTVLARRPNSDTFTYLWNFGDGTATSTASTPAHTFAADGTYTVTLTVTDAWGDAASTTRDVTIAEPPTNVAPVPVIGTPSCAGRVCAFTGAGSSDANGDAFTYLWNFGDATATARRKLRRTRRVAGHLYGDAHRHRRVGRAATTTRVITLAKPASNQAPSPSSACRSAAGVTCPVWSPGTSDANGELSRYSWNWGDAHGGRHGREPRRHTRTPIGGHLHGDPHHHRRVGRRGDRNAGRHGGVTLKLER